MTTIRQDDFIQSIADAFQYISYYHPVDYIKALAQAYEREQSPAAKDAIAQILINSRMCAEGHRPICQDTGIALVFLKVGMDVHWDAALSVQEMVDEGVRRAYLNPDNKLRASVLRDPAGKRQNSKDNTCLLYTSLRHAIAMLGRRQLQRWLQLLLFTQRAEGASPGQPLLTLAATRGKCMELMMGSIVPGNRGQADQAFMVGVLSLLDALFGAPLPELLRELNLADPVRAALLDGEGVLGRLLGIVRSFERNQFGELAGRLREFPQLPLSHFNQMQLQALGWASEVSASNGE